MFTFGHNELAGVLCTPMLSLKAISMAAKVKGQETNYVTDTMFTLKAASMSGSKVRRLLMMIRYRHNMNHIECILHIYVYSHKNVITRKSYTKRYGNCNSVDNRLRFLVLLC